MQVSDLADPPARATTPSRFAVKGSLSQVVLAISVFWIVEAFC
jgi:hypothetical protein